MEWMKITLLVLVVIFLGVYVYAGYFNDKSSDFIDKEKKIDNNNRSSEISIELISNEATNNGEFAVSIPFRIVNNSDQDLTYLVGCSTIFPKPYQYIDGQISEEIAGYTLDQNFCTALPDEFVVKAGNESKTEYWGQTDYVNKVVPEGEYVIAVSYWLGERENYGVVYSAPISIKRESWDEAKIQEVCESEPYGSPGRYKCYVEKLVEVYDFHEEQY